MAAISQVNHAEGRAASRIARCRIAHSAHGAALGAALFLRGKDRRAECAAAPI
jgi:hypothetical protein